MARWAWSVRQAELRKVRSARGFRAAQRSDRLAPKASMGNGRLSAVGREGTAGTRLLRLDKPASGRRHHATVAAVRNNLRIHRARKAGYRESWQLHIFGAENQRKFLQRVDVKGEKFFAAREALAQLERVTARANSDTVPVEVWNEIKHHMSEREWTDQDFALATNTRFDGERMWTHAPGRKRRHRIARVFDDCNLHDLTTNDVFWDKIVEITSIGEHDVYDGTVSGTHNFVAN